MKNSIKKRLEKLYIQTNPLKPYKEMTDAELEALIKERLSVRSSSFLIILRICGWNILAMEGRSARLFWEVTGRRADGCDGMLAVVLCYRHYFIFLP